MVMGIGVAMRLFIICAKVKKFHDDIEAGRNPFQWWFNTCNSSCNNRNNYANDRSWFAHQSEMQKSQTQSMMAHSNLQSSIHSSNMRAHCYG